MANVGGLIGKFLTGSAAAAMPFALEEHRSKIQAKRDEVLNQYADTREEATRQHQTSLAERQMAHAEKLQQSEQQWRSTEAKETRAFEGKWRQVELDMNEAQFDLQYQQTQQQVQQSKASIDQAERQLAINERGQNLVNEINSLKLTDAKDIRGLWEKIMDPEIKQEQRDAAVSLYNILSGKKGLGTAIEPIKTTDEMGLESTAGFMFFDRDTKTATKFMLEDIPSRSGAEAGGGGGGGMNTPEAVRDAYHAGTITREQARARIEELNKRAAE